MDCRQCEGIETFFNQKLAAGELKKYREKGPSTTTQLLIDALKAEEVEGLTLLDIGGGIGAIQHELMNASVASATSVDASSAYIEAAREEAERRGHADRVAYRHGNFVTLAPDLPQADIVTLDRVICCYHDMESLVGLSSALAGKLYGVVYPRDGWRFRIGWKVVGSLENLFLWARRNPFRAYLHPTKAVDAVVRANGLERRFYRKAGIWQVVVYAR